MSRDPSKLIGREKGNYNSTVQFLPIYLDIFDTGFNSDI